MRRSRESFSNETDESNLQYEKHDEQRISTFRGIVIDLRAESENAFDSMHRSCESFSNKIDESDLQYEKHDEQMILIAQGIVTSSSQPKYRINFDLDESKMNDDSTMKCELPDSM
jgi:hypothetical protein